MESSSDEYSPSETTHRATGTEDEDLQPESLGRNSQRNSLSSPAIGIPGARKRKRAAAPSKSLFQYKKGSKRVRISSYSNEYREFFNETLEERIRPSSRDKAFGFHPSQIGSVRWSAAEKDLFFACLDREGRDGVKAIAAAVGTKSQPEIEAYLQLLEQGALELKQHGEPEQLYDAMDTPAAYEISPLCEDLLEDLADGLAAKQLAFEEKIQERKYGSLWNLDFGIANMLMEQNNNLGDRLPDAADGDEIKEAMELLNLQMFVETSTNVFMNSSNAESNYHAFAAPGQTPSIQLTAFMDLHNLALMITKRVVAASHFYALTRLRALSGRRGRKGLLRERTIRTRDVYTALSALGLGRNAHSFWVGAARRCGLNVFEDPERRVDLREWFEHDKVEELLQEPIRRLSERTSALFRDDETQMHFDVEESYSTTKVTLKPSQPEVHDYDSRSDNTDSEIEVASDDGKAARSVIGYERLQDSYMKALDQESSREEELSLWNMMGKEPPVEYLSKQVDVPKRPPKFRRSKEDLIGWRWWLQYQTQWERDEYPIAEESFAENRRLMVLGRQAGEASRRETAALGSRHVAASAAFSKGMVDLAVHSDGDSSTPAVEQDVELASDNEAQHHLTSPDAGQLSLPPDESDIDVLTSDAISEQQLESEPSQSGSEQGSLEGRREVQADSNDARSSEPASNESRSSPLKKHIQKDDSSDSSDSSDSD